MSVLQSLPQRYFSRDIFNSYPTGRGPQTVDSVYVPGSVGLQPSWSVGENSENNVALFNEISQMLVNDDFRVEFVRGFAQSCQENPEFAGSIFGQSRQICCADAFCSRCYPC